MGKPNRHRGHRHHSSRKHKFATRHAAPEAGPVKTYYREPKKSWKSGEACPRCESGRRFEFSRAPVIVACGDCSFVFTVGSDR
jgi:hypothetical protein